MAHEATDLRKGRPSVSLFSVQNVSARGLTRKTLFGTSEPFVRLLVLPDQDNVCSGYEKIQSIEQFAATTPTASSSSSPNWSDKFVVKVDDANCWLFAEVLDHSKLVAGKSLIQSSYGYCAYHVNFLKSVGSEARSYESQLVARRGSKTKAKGSISISVKKIEPDAFQREDMECNKVFRCDPEVEEGWIESRLDSEELPSGWEGRKDQNGRVYYLNHASRTTQWNKPSFSDSSARNHILSRSSDGSERQIRAARTQVCEETGDGGLENGELSSIDQKVNDDASWINERERNANVNRELNVKTENEGAGGGGDDLPPGWEMRAAKNGRVYFVDHVNEITTWVDPRLGVRSREGNSSAANAQLVLDMLMGTRGGVVAGNIALSDSNSTTGSDAGVSHPVKVLPAGWEERATKDGRVFYVDHNTQTTSWQDPRLLMEGPAVQFNPNYKSKYKAFKAKLRKAPSSSAHCVIRVTRANLLETSFDSICRIVKDDPSRLRCKLWVEYAGEQGLDYGGMSREWFQDVSCQMLDPYYGLFEYSAADSSYSLQINPLSALCCGRDHLKYFSFVGTVCAMAIYHGKLIDGYFVKSFYKTLLGKEVVLEDLESVDIRYYQSMKMLLECGEEELAEIEADFTLSEHQLEGGRAPAGTVSLLPNGNEIPVTIHNREQFVQLVLQYKLVEQVQSQMEAFLSGFSLVVDPSLLKLFDETELELLMAGLPQVNVKDWKDHTLYKRGYSEEHEVIQWFWRVVLDYSDEERCRLLKFVTGTSHLPLHGFSQLQGSDGPQMFTIQRSDTQTTTAQHLPKAHTCFNLLDLPRYRSYSEMKSKLTMAINHSSEFAIS